MVICLCGKNFGTRSSLYLHIRKFHGGDYEKYIVGDKKQSFCSGRKCPSCGLLCKNMEGLCEHIGTFHGIQMQFTSHAFNSHTDFKSWLLAVKSVTCAQFVQESKKNLRLCHRSGYYVSKLTAMKRKRAVKGFVSNKIGAVCPAHIKVVADTAGRVEIKFQSVHFGHENLTQVENNEIAEKLMEDICRKPNEERQFKVRRAIPVIAPKLTTPNLLQKIEMKNALIHRKLNVNVSEECLSEVNKHQDAILKILDTGGNPTSLNLTEEAAPAKIKSQPRLFSIKKNNKTNKVGKANSRITTAEQKSLPVGIAKERSDNLIALEHPYAM